MFYSKGIYRIWGCSRRGGGFCNGWVLSRWTLAVQRRCRLNDDAMHAACLPLAIRAEKLQQPISSSNSRVRCFTLRRKVMTTAVMGEGRDAFAVYFVPFRGLYRQVPGCARGDNIVTGSVRSLHPSRRCSRPRRSADEFRDVSV